MKKSLKLIFSFFTVSLMGFNGTIACSPDSANIPTGREWAVSMLNPKNYNEITDGWKYYNFIKKYENAIKNPASDAAKKQFDDLYDNSNSKIWYNYQDLETSLTTTILGEELTANVNWTNLFNQVNLSSNEITTAQTDLLRFYNIIAKLYNKNNILRLVQKATFESLTPNVFGYTLFRQFKSDDIITGLQKMGFGNIFINQKSINNTYNAGYGATNGLISTPVHEYGHAISNFLSCNEKGKKYFNLVPYKNQQLSPNDIVNDRTQLLMDYLDQKANIGSNSTEKLLFPLIVVRSNYGRARWLEHKAKLNDEFFAEAFDQWLETPANARDWNWELLNGFFINVLPTYL